jgi:hypothetical protein
MPPSHHLKWLGAEEVAPSHFLSTLYFPTPRARKQMPLCSRGITNGYAVLSPRTRIERVRGPRCGAFYRNLTRFATEHRSVAAGGRARAAYPGARIPLAARYFAHDARGAHDARPGGAGAGSL